MKNLPEELHNLFLKHKVPNPNGEAPMKVQFNWIENREENKESQSVKYFDKPEEYRFAVPLINSLKRCGDWTNFKSWFMKSVNLFSLRSLEGAANYFAILQTFRIQCCLGMTGCDPVHWIRRG